MPNQTFPRISGFLNNCALHACVPELIIAFRHFAMLEDGFQIDGFNEHSPLQLERLSDFYFNYQTLKQIFANYYNVNNDVLTFRKLYELLTQSVNNNSVAAQIILGPVLREFLCSKMRLSDTFTNKYSQFLKTLDVDGRFPVLEDDIVAQFVCNPLGMSLTSYTEQNIKNQNFSLVNSVFDIDLYYMGNHWERMPSALCRTVASDYPNLTKDCPRIATVADIFSGAQTIADANEGLKVLKESVTVMIMQLLTEQDKFKIKKNNNFDLSIVEEDFQDKYVDSVTKNLPDEVKLERKKQIKNMVTDLLLKGKQGLFSANQSAKDNDHAYTETDEQFAMRMQEDEIKDALCSNANYIKKSQPGLATYVLRLFNSKPSTLPQAAAFPYQHKIVSMD